MTTPPPAEQPLNAPPIEEAPSPRQKRAQAAAPESWLLTLFMQLIIVVTTGVIAATLFTFWTPGIERPASGNFSLELPAASTSSLSGTPDAATRGPVVIGVVAGHWKNDSGAVCPDGLREVDVNLQVASLVQKALSEEGYRVDLLEEFDPRLTDYRAAALVSIHNDSCDYVNDQASGYKVAAAMANRHPEMAARLTACLRQRYGKATGLAVHSTSVTSDMTLYHAFGEINELTPAAIIETGFLNLDRELLTKHPDKVAQGIVDGILCFVRNESIVPPTAAPVAPATPASTPPASPYPTP